MIHSLKYLYVPVVESISFSDIPHFSKRDKAYQLDSDALRPFYKYDVGIAAFEEVISNRSKFKTNRALLHKVVKAQYNGKKISDKLKDNIEGLTSEKTFTVITAHQPSILTGPLYYIIKICSVISLCRDLTEHYDGYRFVPTFIMGGEDHDFDEIASLNYFNKTFTWKTEQVGSVGRMTLDGLEDLLNEVRTTFGSMPHASKLKELIDDAFTSAKTYGEFMQTLTHNLFRHTELMIINMDDAELKTELLPYIIKDIEDEVSHHAVNADQKALDTAGFKSQAHAREVNIFIHDGDRHRVIKTDEDHYEINNQSYTKTELISYLRQHPGHISPNVVLRPIYQELVLPNLAYVGGGGELAYWMERGTLFEQWSIPYPMLIRRDSALIVDQKALAQAQKLSLSIADLFERDDLVAIKYAKEQSTSELDLSLERDIAATLFEKLHERATKIDPTLSGAVKADEAKFLKVLSNMENKLIKAEKRKNEVAINRISKLKGKLFPSSDKLQERYENFIPFYLNYGQSFIDQMIECLNPMDKNFKVILLAESESYAGAK
jgi:bacillithiol biosynthesis cysteine-adding enzyme BshC